MHNPQSVYIAREPHVNWPGLTIKRDLLAQISMYFDRNITMETIRSRRKEPAMAGNNPRLELQDVSK